MGENILSGFFGRLEQLMKHFGVSTVNELAIKHLKYDAPQKINRLKKQGANPSAEIIADIIKLWPSVNANWLLLGTGEMFARDVNKIETQSIRPPSIESVLLVMAEGYKAQVETIKSIESKMAQQADQLTIKEKVQATDARTKNIELNLILVLETLRTVGVRQEADEEVSLESLARLEGKPENELFEDAGRRKGRIEKAAGIHGKKGV